MSNIVIKEGPVVSEADNPTREFGSLLLGVTTTEVHGVRKKRTRRKGVVRYNWELTYMGVYIGSMIQCVGADGTSTWSEYETDR